MAMMRIRFDVVGAATLFIVAQIVCAPPATGDPAADPCGFAASMFCRFVPIAPELAGDIDLTQNQPPTGSGGAPPDSLLIADICAEGCI